jgi:succinate dehydrogenase / fumarate reductase iron-sulfur subunit
MNQIFRIIIHRFRDSTGQWTQEFEVTLDGSQTVLDGIEQIWIEQDRTLMFKHACHHASCGSCGVIINGQEKLPCITPMENLADHSHTLEIEPLHNFPVLADLVVDMARLFESMHRIDAQIISIKEIDQGEPQMQYSDCIECGLCLSACPVVATDSGYIGPAALAAAYPPQEISEEAWNTIQGEHGLWRCHATFECSDVCPSNVDPAGKIMALRRLQMAHTLKSVTGMTP